MQKIYKRADLVITAFDVEDVITTSGILPPVIPPEPDPEPEDPIHVDYGSGSSDPPFDWW